MGDSERERKTRKKKNVRREKSLIPMTPKPQTLSGDKSYPKLGIQTHTTAGVPLFGGGRGGGVLSG